MGKIPILTNHFSKGLKPPTSVVSTIPTGHLIVSVVKVSQRDMELGAIHSLQGHKIIFQAHSVSGTLFPTIMEVEMAWNGYFGD